MTEEVKVTQADREALAALCLQRWVNAHGTELEWMKGEANKIVNGSADRDITALAFARHRIAAQAELLEALEFLADAASASKGFASPMALGQARTAIAKAKGEQ